VFCALLSEPFDVFDEGFFFWYANSAVSLESLEDAFFERLLNRGVFGVWDDDVASLF
jgi:hypothetical protein